MGLKDCFDKGLLKKIAPDQQRSSASIKLAKHYLQRAEGNFKFGFHDVTILMAYNAMLQASRAILYKDGIKERSHGCVSAYLKENYEGISKEIESLDYYRENRHIIQYEGGEVSKEDASTAIRECKAFVKAVEKLLKGRI